MKKVIGENIRILRENAEFTQDSLAKYLDVDQSLISKIENGERCITADMMERIASLFGVTVEQMEETPISVSKLSFAFRGSKLSVEDMEAISAINAIALNSEFMNELLKGVKA